MNIEEIIENTVRKVVREELERYKNSITPTLPNEKNSSPYGDIEWLCEFFGVEKQTVYGYNSARKFPFTKRGKKVVYNKEEIKKLAESNRFQSADEIKKQTFQDLAKQRIKRAG